VGGREGEREGGRECEKEGGRLCIGSFFFYVVESRTQIRTLPFFLSFSFQLPPS